MTIALLSKLSHLYNWIKSFKLDARVFCRKPPVDTNLSAIAFILPSRRFSPDGLDIR